MTPQDLIRLFDTCAASVFRLETLQHYTVPGDEERQRAFHEGRPLPPPSKAKQDTLTWITESIRANKRIHRAHVVELPPHPYIRYELAVYRENVQAGEPVFIADRAAHPDLASLRNDFCLFDAETNHPIVVWFHYDANGRLQRYERTDDPRTIQACCRQRDLVLAHAVHLDEFVTKVLARQ
jgi:hypothetical protein